MIRHLKHTDINRTKWDECIRFSGNGLIYACSWYLDIICPGWEALVKDEYTCVMPLPLRKRFAISYVYAPLYAQQLGVFGDDVSSELLVEFLDHIPVGIRFCDMKLNEQNFLVTDHFTVLHRKNFTLDTSGTYESVHAGYNRNCRRNIRKATDSGMSVGEALTAHDFALFIGKNLQDQISDLNRQAVDLLGSVTGEALNRGSCEIATLQNAAGKICAAGSFLFYRDRVIFAVCASTPEGKQYQAMSMLVDQQIRKYAGKYAIFDFSGSELKGVAHFNAGFGGIEAPYPFVHFNRLNWLQRLISGKLR